MARPQQVDPWESLYGGGGQQSADPWESLYGGGTAAPTAPELPDMAVPPQGPPASGRGGAVEGSVAAPPAAPPSAPPEPGMATLDPVQAVPRFREPPEPGPGYGTPQAGPPAPVHLLQAFMDDQARAEGRPEPMAGPPAPAAGPVSPPPRRGLGTAIAEGMKAGLAASPTGIGTDPTTPDAASAFGRGLNVGATATLPRLGGQFMQAMADVGDMGLGPDTQGDAWIRALGERLSAYGVERGEELAQRFGESPGFREAPVEWLAENLGQALPSTIPAIAGGMAAGPAGALAVGGAMGAGDIRGELEEAGMEPGGKMTALTMGGAVPYALADMLMPARVGSAIMKGGAAKGFGPMFGSALRAGVEEGVAEGAQSTISQGAAAIGAGKDVDWGRVGEEAIRGAAAGPFFGAGGQALATRRQEGEGDLAGAPGPVEADPMETLPVPTEPEMEAEPVQEAEPVAEQEAVVEPEPVPEPEPVAAEEPNIFEEPIAEPEPEAPEWANQSIEPEQPSGERQRTVFPGDDSKVETEYQVVDAGQLRASHTTGYAQRPETEFPTEIQGRAYHGKRGQQAREHTEGIVSSFDADRALDKTISAAEGPPVVTPSGVVVAGNGRTIAQQRVYETENGPALKEQLAERAAEFGIDPAEVAGMDSPVLVRRIVDENVDTRDVGTLQALNTSSDQPIGKTKDPISEGATKAASLKAARTSLEHFAETVQPDDTIKGYLGGAGGKDFLSELVKDGVITPAERARYIDVNTGVATDEGKQLVERMFYVAALGDADVVSRAPKGALRKLDTSLPAIIRADEVGGEWSVGSLVGEAVDVLAGAQASGMTLDDFTSQIDFERAPPDPTAVEMARFLSGPKTDVRDAFRKFANNAEEFTRQTGSVDMFGFTPPGAKESLSVFGIADRNMFAEPGRRVRELRGAGGRRRGGAGRRRFALGGRPSARADGADVRAAARRGHVRGRHLDVRAESDRDRRRHAEGDGRAPTGREAGGGRKHLLARSEEGAGRRHAAIRRGALALDLRRVRDRARVRSPDAEAAAGR